MASAWAVDLLHEKQGAVIESLKEENRVLRDNLGDKPLVFTDAQRHRLARRGKAVGSRGLRELGCIVNPDTFLRYHSTCGNMICVDVYCLRVVPSNRHSQ